VFGFRSNFLYTNFETKFNSLPQTECKRKGDNAFANLGGVWFGCFLFSFSLKTENGDENVFGLISENIFSENKNSKQLENENKKF